MEVATADYEGLNGLLKEELPGFFWLRTQLMEPILLSLYYIQARIHAILWDRIDPLSRSGYYDLTMDVLNGYESRKDDINLTLESVEIIKKGSGMHEFHCDSPARKKHKPRECPNVLFYFAKQRKQASTVGRRTT